MKAGIKSAPRARATLPRMTKAEGFTRHPFDAKWGVQTSGLIPGRLLKTGHKHDRHSTAYFGVAPSVFRALVRRWQRTRPAAPIEQFAFIDVGAGMGRAMLLAAEFPFKQVVGIELNPVLAKIAQKNLKVWRASDRAQMPMRVLCGDAVTAPMPDGPCAVFLFNPFGASVLKRLLKRLAVDFADRAGQLDLLYVNHEQEWVLEKQPGFRRLFIGRERRSKADAIVDHRIMANQPDGEYASSNYEECSLWRWTGEA